MFKLIVYDVLERFTQTAIAPIFRNAGKGLVQQGVSFQGNLASDDVLVPSMRCRPSQGIYPKLQNADFVAPNATVVGDVTLGQKSSIWYGTTVRGDISNISIGSNSIIQDLTTILPNSSEEKVDIGDNVLIGPNSYIESCRIESNCFIGMGSTIRKGSSVQSNSVVAAGAVIEEGSEVQGNQIWAGNPAKYLRDLTPEELQVIQEHHEETLHLARIHAEETNKSFREVIDDMDKKHTEEYKEVDEQVLEKLKEYGWPTTYDDEEYVEQRVYVKEHKTPFDSEYWKKNYDPYEQDLHHFPDSFKVYGDSFEKYDDLKKYFEENPTSQAQTVDRQTFQEPTTDHKPWTRKF